MSASAPAQQLPESVIGGECSGTSRRLDSCRAGWDCAGSQPLRVVVLGSVSAGPLPRGGKTNSYDQVHDVCAARCWLHACFVLHVRGGKRRWCCSSFSCAHSLGSRDSRRVNHVCVCRPPLPSCPAEPSQAPDATQPACAPPSADRGVLVGCRYGFRRFHASLVGSVVGRADSNIRRLGLMVDRRRLRSSVLPAARAADRHISRRRSADRRCGVAEEEYGGTCFSLYAKGPAHSTARSDRRDSWGRDLSSISHFDLIGTWHAAA